MLDLYPFQEEGAAFLSQFHRGRFLADDMGLGKTAQAVRACDLVSARNILVVCPGVARKKWLREFDKFSITGFEGRAILDGRTKPLPHGLNVISYDLMRQDRMRRWLYDVGPWDVVVADEGHFLKERSARRTRLFYGKGGVADRANRTWLLSGTPAPNNYAEWWPHLRKFGYYDGDYWSFVQRYCSGFQTDYGFEITGGKNIPELQALLSEFMLRRYKEDVLDDLPPLTIGERYLERPKDPPMILEDLELEANLKAALQDGPDALEHLVHPQLRRLWGMAKVGPTVQAAREFLEASGEKLVLYGYHPAVLDAIARQLDAYEPVVVHGKTKGDGSRQVDRFDQDPRCRVFIGQMQSAGTAIDLVAASTLWIVEPDWTPGVNEQVIDRVHRMGQTRPVLAEFLILPDTVDEDIQTAYVRKAQTLAQLYDRESELRSPKPAGTLPEPSLLH